jgi:hypothetical protein
VAAVDQGRRQRKEIAVSPVNCLACGKPIPDAAPTCPHCGQPTGRTGRKRGLPVWGKLILFLLLGTAVVGFAVASKPSEAELRQAIRDKGKELKARGMITPLVLIDDPQYAERFTYHNHFLSSEVKYTAVNGKVITVATGSLGSVSFLKRWEGAR